MITVKHQMDVHRLHCEEIAERGYEHIKNLVDYYIESSWIANAIVEYGVCKIEISPVVPKVPYKITSDIMNDMYDIDGVQVCEDMHITTHMRKLIVEYANARIRHSELKFRFKTGKTNKTLKQFDIPVPLTMFVEYKKSNEVVK